MKKENHIKRIGVIIAPAAGITPIANAWTAFYNYSNDLERSVNDAQTVPAQIDAFIKSNQAGVRLLSAAMNHQDAAYQKGVMDCSALIRMAATEAGVNVMGWYDLPFKPVPPVPFRPCDPKNGCKLTDTEEAAIDAQNAAIRAQKAAFQKEMAATSLSKVWFDQGMGPEFRQIWGGTTGGPLTQLAADEGNEKISIPIGAVIVTPGHAALFNGQVKVGTQWQIITYDANDAEGWTVSLEGKASKDDPEDKMLSFPGHQVGDHVTRLQWGSKTSQVFVKVFQPIGNHSAAQVKK